MFCYCGRLYIIVKLFAFFPSFSSAGVSSLGNENIFDSQTRPSVFCYTSGETWGGADHIFILLPSPSYLNVFLLGLELPQAFYLIFFF